MHQHFSVVELFIKTALIYQSRHYILSILVTLTRCEFLIRAIMINFRNRQNHLRQIHHKQHLILFLKVLNWNQSISDDGIKSIHRVAQRIKMVEFCFINSRKTEWIVVKNDDVYLFCVWFTCIFLDWNVSRNEMEHFCCAQEPCRHRNYDT